MKTLRVKKSRIGNKVIGSVVSEVEVRFAEARERGGNKRFK